MPVSWTRAQKEVIDTRDKSLLVSAAAGSGKTAVLVERIIKLVTDREHPVDIDRLLVVTFTNAAAAEMRERVGQAIEKALAKDPLDLHLQRQSSLIHSAQITTIDSFCLWVVKNNFCRVGIDPDIRVGDEGEVRLIAEDAARTTLEKFYKKKDPDFLAFASGYSAAKSDAQIKEMMLRLHEYSQSYPRPDEWLAESARQYVFAPGEEIDDKDWAKDLKEYVIFRLEDELSSHRKRLDICREDDGPAMYEAAVKDDIRLLEGLCGCGSLKELYEGFSKLKFKNIGSSRSFDGSEEKKQSVKAGRDALKNTVNKLKKDYFSSDLDSQKQMLEKTGRMADALIALVIEYTKEFSSLKREKNILDFSDIEHFALDILCDKKTGQYTDAAKSLRDRFYEVMIDEYQDSNYLQEEILKAVSGIPEGRENMFMVGDVKQSIYSFRLARPELFSQKYDTYSKDGNISRAIDLDKNFRSAGPVIETVNDIFRRIMDEDIGNIRYDDRASLKAGLTSDVSDGSSAAEVILIDDPFEKNKRYEEGLIIASRIKTLVQTQEIPGIRYRDIAVLLRTLSSWTQDFQEAFDDIGVPLIVSSRKGYFSAPEVQTVLSILRVTDNPRQDIPLTAVMRSPAASFSDSELSAIKSASPKKRFHECVLDADSGMLPEELADKLDGFKAYLKTLRDMAAEETVTGLIRRIYADTGIYSYYSVLPGGALRRANLDILLEKASSFEDTGRYDVFSFIKYIDRLISCDVDYGEAETVSEGADAVRLTSIHKSKGLEYPVVIAAGMGKNFNFQDTRSAMVLDSRRGVALKWQDHETRTKSDTLIRRAFSLEGKRETLGEEMRVLYVALTRAKKKLILCGTGKIPENASSDKLTFSDRFDASCPYDWVLPALSDVKDRYLYSQWDHQKYEALKAAGKFKDAVSRAQIEKELGHTDEELAGRMRASMEGRYPFEGMDIKKQKVSVSELKKRGMAGGADAGGEGYELFKEEVPLPYIPRFAGRDEENSGLLYGTAMHRVLECLDFADLGGLEDETQAAGYLATLLGKLRDEALISDEEAGMVSRRKLAAFLSCDIAKRMTAAAKKGRLFKEKPFVMEVPAKIAGEGEDAEGNVLIQGIIDVFWEEDDGIVLLDYKTDKVKEYSELTDRYRMQLLYYAEALKRFSRGKSVKEIYIYSFALGGTVSVK